MALLVALLRHVRQNVRHDRFEGVNYEAFGVT
jgi:hypothetical protein